MLKKYYFLKNFDIFVFGLRKVASGSNGMTLKYNHCRHGDIITLSARIYDYYYISRG